MTFSEMTEIIAGEISPSDRKIAGDIFRLYLERTKKHIETVRMFGMRACQCLKDDERLADNLELLVDCHDEDKLNDALFMAHYAPYVVKRYCGTGLEGRFELKPEYVERWNEEYVVTHCLANGHHPECWDRSYGYGENHPPYDATAMTTEYLAEMVCDWCAVGLEQGNSAMDWFRKVNGERFIFTDFQKSFIERLIRAIE